MGKRRRSSSGPGGTRSRWSTQRGWNISEHDPRSAPAAASAVLTEPVPDAAEDLSDAGEEVATVPGSRIDWYGDGYPAGTTPDRDERAFRMLETLLR